jgi:hypothetical protein
LPENPISGEKVEVREMDLRGAGGKGDGRSREMAICPPERNALVDSRFTKASPAPPSRLGSGKSILGHHYLILGINSIRHGTAV